MNSALGRHAAAFGVTALAMIACNHNSNDGGVAQHPAEPRAVVNPPTLADRRAAERRAEERRDEARAEERRAEERAGERRAEERRAEERRADDTVNRRAIGGGPVAERTSSRSAVGRIADARCDREVRCHGVGGDKKYANRAACVSDVEADKRDDLNPRACPGGIDEKQLEKCVDAIRADECGNPFDNWTRLNACRSGNLCVK
jgi:hypothetical protein